MNRLLVLFLPLEAQVEILVLVAASAVLVRLLEALKVVEASIRDLEALALMEEGSVLVLPALDLRHRPAEFVGFDCRQT